MMRQWKAMRDALTHSERVSTEQQSVTLLQTRIMVNQAEITQQSLQNAFIQTQHMQRQLDAMEQQAKAMREQAKLMDRSLVLSTRAYVCLSDLNIDFTDTKQLIIKFENIGKVPAEELKVRIMMTVSFPDPQWIISDEVRQFSSYELKRNYGINALYPGTFKAELRIWLEQYLAAQEITLLAEWKGFFGVVAELDYGDGFEENQHSAFCFMYRDGGWTMHPVWPDRGSKTDEDRKDKEQNPN